ncbi:MAG TPA: type II secretion system protein M [Gammaproteobacteria bacterium]|nr:type II secretion system protein M [Gammaproteobacteria bacterium]
MKEWFLSREPRERIMLGAGAVLAAVIVFYGALWLPLAQGTAQLGTNVEQKSRLLVDLERAAALGPSAARAAPSPAAAQSMVGLVDSTARQHDLAKAFTRTRQDGPDGISVTFQDAPFDALLGWIVALQTGYGVGVESASFNGARTPGLVSGQVLLRRR